MIGSGIIIIPQFLLFLVVGVLLYYYYQLNPPSAAFENPDRIFPHFIISHFPPVAAGLVVACSHQPGLSYALADLTGCGVVSFRRPGAAVVQLNAPRAGAGELWAVLPPRVLRAAAPPA